MALWTDYDFVTAADLGDIDGEIIKNVQVNPALGVTLEGPGSIIRNTIQDCGTLLMSQFQSFSGYLAASGTTNAALVAVISNTGNTAVVRPRLRLFTVVALEVDPTKLGIFNWVRFKCLEQTFRAVFRRYTAKDLDRYALKVADYQQEAKRSYQILKGLGLPAIVAPLDAPGAVRQQGAGAFAQSNVWSSGSGSSDTGNVWYVCITWVGSGYVSPSNNGNAESGRSAVQSWTTMSGEVITVSISGLNPPNGIMPSLGTADGIYSPMAATGWNVYIGSSANGPFYLQNASPISLSTTTYALANQPVQSGNVLLPGQYATMNHSFQDVITRA